VHLVVVGATGRTGQRVLLQALSRGHTVTAVVRRPEALPLRDDRLTVAAADVLDPDALLGPLAGAGAVVSTVGGGTSKAPTTVYSLGVRNVLRAMQANGIRRLSVISAAPAGPRAEQPFLERRLLMPVLDRVFGATYEDMRRMEALLWTSDLDWIALRPPRLVDKPGTGRYRLDWQKPLAQSRTLTYADLATALLDSLGRERLYRRAAYVAN
jgi:putative NADH-flavin reductase